MVQHTRPPPPATMARAAGGGWTLRRNIEQPENSPSSIKSREKSSGKQHARHARPQRGSNGSREKINIEDTYLAKTRWTAEWEDLFLGGFSSKETRQQLRCPPFAQYRRRAAMEWSGNSNGEGDDGCEYERMEGKDIHGALGFESWSRRK